jgi:hypothetical protein
MCCITSKTPRKHQNSPLGEGPAPVRTPFDISKNEYDRPGTEKSRGNRHWSW